MILFNFILNILKNIVLITNQTDKFLSAVISDKRGQSMAEYSLLMAGITGLFLTAGYDLFPRFIRAFQLYFDSYYFMLNLPIP